MQNEAAAVELPRPLSSAWRPGTELQIQPLGPDAAFLFRSNLSFTGFLAGSLSSLSAAEVAGFIVSGIRSGRLIFTRGNVRKVLHFRDGEVVFASSTEPWERLGAALVLLELVTREQLDAALKEVRPGTKLGQVLTANGVLTPAQLYSGMTWLVREILLDLFTETEGQLLFLEDAPLPEDVLKLPDATKDLVLQGIGRGEEVRRLRAKLPQELRVAQGATVPSEAGRVFWTQAAKGVDLRVLRPFFEGSEHAWLSLVDQLLVSGVLVVRPRTKENELPVPPVHRGVRTAARYEALIRAVAEALVKAGRDLDVLRAFLREPLDGHDKAFRGVALDEAGRFDAGRVLVNLGVEAEGADRTRAWEALDAFVSYAMFCARNDLPPELAEALTSDFRQIMEGRDDRR